MARSKIWKYFDKIDLQTAQCMLCEKIIKTCGNTSNLMKHMKTHPTIDVNDHQSIVVRGMLKRDPNSMKTRGKKILKYTTGKVKSEPDTKRQHDADTAADMEDVNLIEFVEAAEAHAAVESVVNEETFAHWATADTESAAETVSAADIIEFEPKEAQDQAQDDTLLAVEAVNHLQTLQDNLAYFVCRDKQPLEIIRGDGFKRLTQVLCPSFRLPTVDQLAARIAHKAQMNTIKIRQMFANIQTLSLSCTINKHTYGVGNKEELSFLEVAAHYHEGVHRRSRMLLVQRLLPEYNASCIVEHLERIFQRFDINKSKIVCIVTPSSRLMENAVASLLGSERHVPCFAQLMERLLESVLERPELSALCSKVRSQVSYHLNSCSSATDLQVDMVGLPLSSFEMLGSFVRHGPIVQKLQPTTLEAPPPALDDVEFELVVELLGVLLPLATAVRQLCGSDVKSYPAASNALPMVYTILNELKQSENVNLQHQISDEIRLFLIRQLEERFKGMEKNALFAMSSLMDPRFRNMPFENISLVAKYMSQLYVLYEERGSEAAESEEEANTDDYDIWAAYRLFSHEKHKNTTLSSSGAESENQDEISSYFWSNISNLQTEPLVLWKDLSQFHPFLYSLSKKYLHIPAASMPPARIFTAAGAEVVSQHAKLLSDHHMSNMLFLSDCTQEEWQL